MKRVGMVRALAVLVIVLVPVGWVLWSFPPYEICVRYYANDAAPSMGPQAVSYAESLCDKKLRFWKS